ncbi:poly-beta-1,6-N-acetyl-D-glucosamine biosynthesis protein PgaD [Dyella sp. M7H15-1]|uniref:poly-beta-1,6-N-acetyl-D-glucosamine biosynthesis protein PgaD n=1 Tax=Dyella sp. M7H15-1 TaxID=2501295 RepID=UPI001004EB28|nr:poly-beta-1,6-N-acetyl-D-glucosamine biosynthesis protein PgaD [Dyella sp. M7H15-1]QAU22925.1 poly-beta-1,6-N-acetyl-D-glucosamine biosynthesis protein PgaD [Dyella sp. M7H15-1]
MRADPIISRPERQKPLQRVLFTVITMLAWTLWMSLWLPLITLIAWLLGLQDIYIKLGLNHPFRGVSDLGLPLRVGIVAALSLGAWAFYNRMRFAGKQKRRANRFIELAEMAPALETAVHTAQRLRASRRLVVHFNDNGEMFLPPDES